MASGSQSTASGVSGWPSGPHAVWNGAPLHGAADGSDGVGPLVAECPREPEVWVAFGPVGDGVEQRLEVFGVLEQPGLRDRHEHGRRRVGDRTSAGCRGWGCVCHGRATSSPMVRGDAPRLTRRIADNRHRSRRRRSACAFCLPDRVGWCHDRVEDDGGGVVAGRVAAHRCPRRRRRGGSGGVGGRRHRSSACRCSATGRSR